MKKILILTIAAMLLCDHAFAEFRIYILDDIWLCTSTANECFDFCQIPYWAILFPTRATRTVYVCGPKKGMAESEAEPEAESVSECQM